MSMGYHSITKLIQILGHQPLAQQTQGRRLIFRQINATREEAVGLQPTANSLS
jgi:hypothetical protein